MLARRLSSWRWPSSLTTSTMAGKRAPQSYLLPHTHTSKTNVWKMFLKAYKQSTFLLKSPFSFQGQSVYFDILSRLLMRASHCNLIHLFPTPQIPDSMGWLKDSIKIHPNPQCITHTLLWKVKKKKPSLLFPAEATHFQPISLNTVSNTSSKD